ncbi:hypothetical protein PVL29_004753 [Vitis rotundifolia]|uniref:Uncharacterized protein n=1 Tax=Vitis rotundifolia TaxID=103349 RepID=A0AA39A8T5_VITRO|nr:hypothetical protein PVL29_004753 [Vitis rotundifolia]
MQKRERWAVEVEAHWLAKERDVMEADKKKVEKEKHVDDMFFYGYRCCMKKHDITQDTPNYPLDEENEAIGGPTRGKGDASTAGPSCGSA